MGEGAISQSSPSKALRMFCQSRLFLLHNFVTASPRLASPPSCLDKSAPPPRALAIASLWPRWSCVGLLGLVAPHVSCQLHKQSHAIRDSAAACLCYWFQPRRKQKNSPDDTQQTENPHLDLVFRKFISGLDKISFCHRSSFFFFSSLIRTSVWRRNSRLIRSLLHFDCVASSSSEHCLFSQQEIFKEPSQPHQTLTKKKKGFSRTGISQLEKS